MGTTIAGFLMSLALMAIGAFMLHKGFAGNVTADDAAAATGALGVTAGMFGLTFCGLFMTMSSRLARIEKSLDRSK